MVNTDVPTKVSVIFTSLHVCVGHYFKINQTVPIIRSRTERFLFLVFSFSNQTAIRLKQVLNSLLPLKNKTKKKTYNVLETKRISVHPFRSRGHSDIFVRRTSSRSRRSFVRTEINTFARRLHCGMLCDTVRGYL